MKSVGFEDDGRHRYEIIGFLKMAACTAMSSEGFDNDRKLFSISQVFNASVNKSLPVYLLMYTYSFVLVNIRICREINKYYVWPVGRRGPEKCILQVRRLTKICLFGLLVGRGPEIAV